MFQLDDNFLKDVGLQDLPEDQKTPLLEHVYDELELRVGTVLADGLREDQLTEFESLIEPNDQVTLPWLNENVPNFVTTDDYQQMLLSVSDQSSPEQMSKLYAEYAITKWLEKNRPDYQNVVARVLDDLKKEITANRDAFVQ